MTIEVEALRRLPPILCINRVHDIYLLSASWFFRDDHLTADESEEILVDHVGVGGEHTVG
jgi:hypothetical protein